MFLRLLLALICLFADHDWSYGHFKRRDRWGVFRRVNCRRCARCQRNEELPMGQQYPEYS